MRFFRTLPLVALLVSLPFFLNATCVTRFDQKGSTGPWVGEVTNNGPDVVTNLSVSARIYDARWNPVTTAFSPICPTFLLAGQKGAFEVDFEPWDSLALPLRAQLDPIAGYSNGGWDPSAPGLVAKVVEENGAKLYVTAEIDNQSPRDYSRISICGVVRNTDGTVASVGSASLFPDTLRAGEKATVAIFFTSMPTTNIELFPEGASWNSGTMTLDPSAFHITAKKIMQDTEGRQLYAVGEIENTTGQDLSEVELEAYVAGERAFPVRASVGCNGILPRGTKGQALIIIPLQPTDSDVVIISGIQGNLGQGFYTVPVNNVTSTPIIDTFRVSGTLFNPTDFWLNTLGTCINLRTANGTLVGTGSADAWGQIAPGGTLPMLGEVLSLVPIGNVATTEVISFADVTAPPAGPVY